MEDTFLVLYSEPISTLAILQQVPKIAGGETEPISTLAILQQVPKIAGGRLSVHPGHLYL
jgi:hypothetical protein